jgi:hypothetical protein
MIFVCYRRRDSQWETDRICESLRGAFGRHRVIRDIDTTPPGERWFDYLSRRIRECPVFVLIVGAQWATIVDPSAVPPRRRLEDPNDTIRRELAIALDTRSQLILVNVSDRLPLEHEVPEEVRWVLEHHGVVVRPEPDFPADIQRLVAAIERYVPAVKDAAAVPRPAANDVIPPATVRAFIERVWEAFPSYETSNVHLNDANRIYVELKCETQHDGDAMVPALEFLRTGLADGKAQLLLANFGMGKSFIARRLQYQLLVEYERDPSHSRIPIVFPLKGYSFPRGSHDIIVRRLRGFALEHGLPVGDDQSFRRHLQGGRFCVIFEALDEMPLVASQDDPLHILQLLDQLDMRKSGDCPWLATSRTGLFTTVLPELRRERPYRLAVLARWTPSQWRTYVHKCYELGLLGSDEERDRFLSAIESSPSLNQLTNTPLMARMMVESWRDIVAAAHDFNRIRLYDCYTDYVLNARQDVSALAQLNNRRQCLESAAAFLFRTRRSYLSRQDLVEIALEYLGDVARRDLTSFVARELQTFSLLVCDARTNVLGFSHRSFYEYFLAVAVAREARVHGWGADRLLAAARLDDGEADFLGQWLAESDQSDLRESLSRELHDPASASPPDVRRNLIAIAAATLRAVSALGLVDFAPLASAHLRHADVSGLDLSHCNLEGCDLRGSSAVGTNFSGAVLKHAAITGSNLAGAVFDDTDLTDAQLDRSTLAGLGATTRRPIVSGASFRGVKVGVVDSALLTGWVESCGGDPSWQHSAVDWIRRGTLERSNPASI